MKLNKNQIKELLKAQDLLNQSRQLFESFKEEYIDDLNYYSFDLLDDKIYELEIIENDIDKEFKLTDN
jgi:CTP:phosphocholine cytidylyltransferase-like protein